MTHLLNHSTLSLYNLIVSFVLKWHTVCMWDHTWIIIVALWTDQEKNKLSRRHQKTGENDDTKLINGQQGQWAPQMVAAGKDLLSLLFMVKCTILCTHIETISGDGWSRRAWWSRWSWWPLKKRAADTLLLHIHIERFPSRFWYNASDLDPIWSDLCNL